MERSARRRGGARDLVLSMLLSVVLAFSMVPLPSGRAWASEEAGTSAATEAEAQAAVQSDVADVAQGTASAAPAEDPQAWDGTVDTSWYDASSTSFTISTAPQLAGLAAIVNGTADGIAADTFTGKTVTLGNDILLNASTPTQSSTSADARAWTPIGKHHYVESTEGVSGTMPIYDDTVYFDGTFDGNGHVVQNIWVPAADGESFGGYNGLFGELGANAVVQNTGVKGGYVYGRVAGGIAAISRATGEKGMPHIIGCYNTATIVGNGATTRGTGGIFGGEEQYTSEGLYHGAAYIANCYNTGSVGTASHVGAPVGGIAGTGSVKIYACYSTASITEAGTLSGALAGMLVGSEVNVGQNSANGFAGFATVHDSYALSDAASCLYRIIDATHSKDAGGNAISSGDDVAFLSASDLQSAASKLSRSFETPESGNAPVLYWENGTKAHTVNGTMDPIRTQVYTGNPIEPKPAVTYSYWDDDNYNYVDVTLHEGSDYTLSYDNNVNVGQATVTATGMGVLTGRVAQGTFTITDADLAAGSIDAIPAQWVYGSTPVTPEVTVRNSKGDVLTAGTDYTVAYSDNVAAGTATVTVSSVEGSGVTGTLTSSFKLAGAADHLNGSGTADDPYQIGTAGDLQFLAHETLQDSSNYAVANYQLTADIDARASDDSPAVDVIGEGTGLGGTFDGNGHTITLGLETSGYAGLINQTASGTGSSLTIKNLTIDGSVTSTGSSASAFVGGSVAQTVTLENCVNKASVSIKSGQSNAGAAAFVVAGGVKDTVTTFKNCVNEGTIDSRSGEGAYYDMAPAGGFIAQLGTGTSCTFDGCSNAGAVYGGGSAGGYIGQAGPNYTSALPLTVTFTNSSNGGAVTSKNYAAGFIGENQNVGPKAFSFAKCSNSGTIVSTGTGDAAGGFVALCRTPLSILNCYNAGDVSCGNTYDSRVGGFVGEFGITDGAHTMTVKNAYNSGTITSGDGNPGAILGRLWYNYSSQKQPNTVELDNVYYRADSAAATVGNAEAGSSFVKAPVVNGQATATDAAAMKDSEIFVGLLGAAFDLDSEGVNGGYPVLVPSDRVVNQITDDMVADIPSVAYTGAAIVPTVTVTDTAGATLSQGTDYVAFTDVDGLTGTVTVLGVGNWTGTVEKTFSITPCALSNCAISTPVAMSYASNPGGEFTQTVTATSPAKTKLVEGTDYTVSYANNKAAGTALILVKGKGYYEGTKLLMFPITKANLSTDATLEFKDHYTGSLYSLDATFTAANGYELTRNSSYSAGDYDTAIYARSDTEHQTPITRVRNAGEYTAVFTGVGSWMGTVERDFTYGIQLASVSIPALKYTGEDLTPQVTVTDADGTVVEPTGYWGNANYTVTYQKDGAEVSSVKDPGTYTATVASKSSSYYGTPSTTFEVVAPEYYIDDETTVSGIDATYLYTGSAVTPVPTEVTIGSNSLVKDVDYTVTYTDGQGNAIAEPVEAGAYNAVITGIGSYVGSKTVPFAIDKPLISVYTQVGPNGTPELAKQYTKAQFEALKSDSTDPVSALYSGTSWKVATATEYVTFEELIADAGVTGWQSGASVKYASGDFGVTRTYDSLQNLMFYPATTASATDTTTSEPAPFVLSIKAGSSTVGENGGSTAFEAEKFNISNATDSEEPRAIMGVTEADYLSGNFNATRGMRLVKNVDTVTVILPADIAGAEIAAIPDQAWTGSAVEPALTVTYDGAVLTEGTDYTVAYKDNVDPGTATATVTGIGAYTGTATASFAIAEPGASERVERLAGTYAADTAAAIASRAFEGATADTVVIARDDDYYDALSGAGLAGALNAPILLTRPNELSAACMDEIEALGATKAVVLGGTSAVSDDVVAALQAKGLSVERVWGENAYGTSLAVSQKLVDELGGSAQYAVAVNPTSFADAVSISGWAYRNKVPVMLQTWGDTAADRGFTDEALQILSGRTVIVCGGTAAVSDESVAGLATVRLGGETLYDTSLAIANWEISQGGMSASDVSIASAAEPLKGVDALAASALAGRNGGVVLLAQSNPEYDKPGVQTETALGFISEHASKIARVHVLGGEAAQTPEFYQQVREALGEK